jgi:hypothetical protein
VIKRYQTPPIPKPEQNPAQMGLPLDNPNKVAVEARGQKKNSKEVETPASQQVQRYLTKIRAASPNAVNDLEAMAQHELNTQAQVDKNITDLEKVNARQDAALKKAMTLDRQQDSDLNGIENQISQLWDRFQTIKSAKPTQSNGTTPAVNYKPTPAPVATGTIKQSTPEPTSAPEPTSVDVPQTVYVAEPEKLPEKDQEIYAQVKNLETELNNKISAMAKWDQVAQMDAKSRNELEALRKDTERTNKALQKKITSFNKRLEKQQSKDMGQVSQVEKTPTLAAPEAGDDIIQKISRANKRAKYGGTATNVIPAGAPDNQQDILHRLSSYSDQAQTVQARPKKTYQKTMGRQRTAQNQSSGATMYETTNDQVDQGAGKELSRSPEIRRLRQVRDYELMLKKELANRIQDRDNADEEQDFQDMNESNMKRMLGDLNDISDADFQTQYGRSKDYWRKRMQTPTAPATDIQDIESDDLNQARTKPTFDRTGRMVKTRRTPVQQSMKRMLGTPKNVRPTPALEPVSVSLRVPNRQDGYDLLPAKIFNSEAEAREFARRVNATILDIRPVMDENFGRVGNISSKIQRGTLARHGLLGDVEVIKVANDSAYVKDRTGHESRVGLMSLTPKYDQRRRANMEEGFQDFNKVEPYAVCLAGKPVKKFDYYEDARRFHDNWKKKLYREGDKAKADKITLMPLDLDEQEQKPAGWGEFPPKQEITIVPPKKLKSGQTYQDQNKYWQSQGQAPIYKTNEMDKSQTPPGRAGDYPLGVKGTTGKPVTAKRVVKDLTKDLDQAFSKEKKVKEAGSPAQQAAIAIAKKKEQGVAEGSGEYKVYYMTAEDHKLMGCYASREEAEQRLNQLQSEYPDNKFIIWTNSKQGVAEGNDDNKIYDRGYRDGFAGKPKNDKGYDGNAWASYRAGYLDGKQAAKSKQGVAEDHADQQRKIFKKNGEPVGEVGIDRESSPGNGQWYIKHYASGKDLAGYDSYEEALAELKHCMKQGVAENDDWDDGDWDDIPDTHAVVKANQPSRYPEQVLRAIERNPAMRADIIADYKRKQGVAEDGSNYQQQLSRALAPNAVGSRYQKDMFATPQQSLAQQTNLKTGATPPVKWKKLNTTTAQDIGVRVDSQYVPAPNGGITVKGMATSYDNKTQYPYALTIDADHQIRYKSVDKLNDDELDAVFQNLASNGLLDRKYINPLKAQIQEEKNKEKDTVKQHAQDQEYVRKDPILNYGGSIGKVKNAISNAKRKNLTAKNDVEAMFAQIGDQIEVNQDQENLINQLSQRLDQADAVNQQQSDVIAKLSTSLKPMAPRQPVAQQQQQQQPVREESTTSTDAVERAVLNRIMVAHTDLLMQFGPEKVMQAVEEVAYGVGDVDEIGTSDVSAWVNQVRQILGAE